jgi:nicotinate phosphoribosyltransferase
MFHSDELAAFRAYAAVMPGNCTLLVDTYDSLDGVRHAITVGRELRAHGHELAGIRLDSGDLAHLSSEARRLLDQAGFPQARIIASNDLDEHLIGSILEQGARVDAWGVGTKLVTCYDQPALGGVYKLGAHRDEHGAWRDVVKLSEQPIKISNPGVLQVRRLRSDGVLSGDIIYDSEHGLSGPMLYDIEDPTRPAISPSFDDADDLLTMILDRGQPTGAQLDLATARQRAASDLAALSPRTRRFLNPQPYPVGLDRHVHARKQALIAAARGSDA